VLLCRAYEGFERGLAALLGTHIPAFEFGITTLSVCGNIALWHFPTLQYPFQCEKMPQCLGQPNVQYIHIGV
jgi:hypothetical protein